MVPIVALVPEARGNTYSQVWEVGITNVSGFVFVPHGK